MIAVADTGFIVAVLNRRDSDHLKSVAIYEKARQVFLPQTALAEIAYLLHHRAGTSAVAEFLEKLPATKVVVLPVNAEDIQKTAVILRQYADSRIDFVDATVMAVAERMGLTTILTLDHRDFRIYRPVHCSYFTLLPEVG